MNHLCNFSNGYHKEQFCKIILNLDQWFRRCHLKDFYLELWRPSCSGSVTILCNFGRGHYGEHSSEIILNFDQWFRWRCLKKKFTDDARRTTDKG